MRKLIIGISALIISVGAAFSQGQLDAYRYGQKDLNGTARYLGMGGAFGALGGDISAMTSNPAGLGVYRSSEVVTTLSISAISAKSDWRSNSGSTKMKDNNTRVNFDNIAYVGYFPSGNDEGIIGWTVGFSYNKLKNYYRKYSLSTPDALDYSLSDYTAARATKFAIPVGSLVVPKGDQAGDDPYGREDWLSVFSYDAAFMNAYKEPHDNRYYSNYNGKLSNTNLNVSEQGSIDQYNLAFGFNVSNFFLFGASVAISDLKYVTNTSYTEDFQDGNTLGLDNYLKTTGTGYSVNLGVILRPADFLRLGVGYNSPTWYKMSDNYYADAFTKNSELSGITTGTPEGNTPYQYRTQDRWLFSAAAILGQFALFSVDYELTNNSTMHLADDYGDENGYSRRENAAIKRNYGVTNKIRIGAEVKITPQFAVRAGGGWSKSPIKGTLKDPINNEVETSGTLTNFTIDRGNHYYSVGLGYRFTPNFYMDAAYVMTTQKEDVSPFSSIFADKDSEAITSLASLKTTTGRFALTLGYKF